MENQIKQITTEDEIATCYFVMKQLRPHFIQQYKFVSKIKQQFNQGYNLIAYIEDGKPKAAMGYRFIDSLAWGKVLYVDDLITDSESRKKGYALKLLDWIKEKAKLENCNQLHLDSAPHRHDAHRFYLKNGFKIACYHFAIDFNE